MSITIRVFTADEMLNLGENLGRLLRGGEVFSLSGPLGAGKTTFVQGVARGLAVPGIVNSPSFAIIHVHEGRLSLVHCDFYRLESPEELENIGFDDYLSPESTVFAEWGRDFLQGVPSGVTTLHIETEGDVRQVHILEVAKGETDLVKEWVCRWQCSH
jgi:tRNA threonylcarbamoyladenosine biosynthesis protein TsaE